MKNRIFSMLLMSVVLFLSTAANGQSFPVVDLNKTNDFSDLKQFGEAIADKRIVYLDELTHGEHEVFALKARLVKYLHQQHGFDALIIESGLFDVNEIVKVTHGQNAQSIKEQAAGNIFFAYANDPAFLELMNYIESKRDTDNPLALSGFDGRLSGEYAVQRFVKQLKKRVEAIEYAKLYLVDWEGFAKQLQDTLERNFNTLSDEQVKQHITRGYQLMDALVVAENDPALGSSSYYGRLLAGVIRLFEVHYKVRRFDEHDLVMADNLHWLLKNEYNNKKVIVWGHYVHVNRQGYLRLRANNVTTALSKAYGEQSYIVNFSALAGQYREFRDGSIKNIPPLSEQHLAYKLKNHFSATAQAIFIEPTMFNQAHYRGLLLQGHEYGADNAIPVYAWQNHFDSTFLINKVSASH